MSKAQNNHKIQTNRTGKVPSSHCYHFLVGRLDGLRPSFKPRPTKKISLPCKTSKCLAKDFFELLVFSDKTHHFCFAATSLKFKLPKIGTKLRDDLGGCSTLTMHMSQPVTEISMTFALRWGSTLFSVLNMQILADEMTELG